ncbi:alkaline phosphatase D family protein [Gloeocapsopsis crepidinum LEGE 06123]|uniref:Alkaline phosphatase D family protein n=3 Tax=Gloeocapsopsis crepidinum TaxID=693223 RepID=A0ABR9ULI1_9CHRO|nr:alkaline phosphatase D family protein [Gloeocapsopsis crepidinum]MBE9189114.1 alkaline phosphatase D family protein [Gloeocapsopsis crepidinum LEGE 06123]
MNRYRINRRSFLKYAAAGFAVSSVYFIKRTSAATNLQPVQGLPNNLTRTWIGRSFWANRLQDWRLHQGFIECLAGDAGDEIRTVSLLTRELIPGSNAAQMSVVVKRLTDNGGGFCGFLIGGGGGQLDYRAAALVQKASGIGGGLLCTYDGHRLRFREHTSEQRPLQFAELPSQQVGSINPVTNLDEEVLLHLDISPQPNGKFQLQLTASQVKTGQVLGKAILKNVADASICGSILLVSSPYTGQAGARYGFRDPRTGGNKIAARPQNTLGPILGTMYSLNGKVLKVLAQFMPIGDTQARVAQFQYRSTNGAWQSGSEATIGVGYTALFRLTNWNSTKDWEYRIVYKYQTLTAYYNGIIRKDPINKSLTMGLVSCTIATARPLDSGIGKPELPNAELLGRYTSQNIYFPYSQLVQNLRRHQPDLLLFVGDQLYETSPTLKDTSNLVLDYLYKWYLWLWSFRSLTRNTPTIVLVDDHDVYQGNIWGENGKPAPNKDENRGGYVYTGSFVNLVQRTQCGHNPDAYDPTPVLQNINVYYGAFRYGGVSFAILEDRKFKSASTTQPPILLGERQEKFLEAWAQDKQGVRAKVCITQTVFGCVATDEDRRPVINNYDSNGFPQAGRNRAIALLRKAGALVVSGDQHLASLVRHGINNFTDGVVQFSGPAGGALWQRWFQPAGLLPNGGSTPYTGDFIDGFGNKMRVLAVANPKITQKYHVDNSFSKSRNLGDRRLKSEGYGIIRVNANEYAIECWSWDIDPTSTNAKQFPGWPYRLPFTQV